MGNNSSMKTSLFTAIKLLAVVFILVLSAGCDITYDDKSDVSTTFTTVNTTESVTDTSTTVPTFTTVATVPAATSTASTSNIDTTVATTAATTATTTVPTTAVKTTVSATAAPATTEKSYNQNPRSRQSLLVTDIHERGAGVDASVLEGTPSTRAEFMDIAWYMNETMTYSVSFSLDPEDFFEGAEFAELSDVSAEIYSCMQRVRYLCPETYSNGVRLRELEWNLVSMEDMLLAAVASYADDDGDDIDRADVTKKYSAASRVAKDIVSEVSKSISDTDSEYKMAMALLNVLSDRCTYVSSTTNIVASCAYGALVNGKANCGGYSAACAMLFKLAGIDCFMMVTENSGSSYKSSSHGWLVADIDGEIHWLDPTWYDSDSKSKPYNAEYAPRTDYDAYLKFPGNSHKFNEEEYQAMLADFRARQAAIK